MRVFVFYNLNQHVWSIKAREGDHYGLVIAHVNEAIVSDARFTVGEGGRQKVIEQQKKNVHAGVVGQLVAVEGLRLRYDIVMPGVSGDGHARITLRSIAKRNHVDVSYNPYKAGYFYTKPDQEPIYEARWVGMYKNRKVKALV